MSDEPRDGVVTQSVDFTLPMSDAEFLSLVSEKEQESKTKRAKDKIDERTERMVAFYKGQQINEGELDNWQLEYMDNAINEDTNYRIALAASRIPDILISPPTDDQDAKDKAQDLARFLEARLNNRSVKMMIKKGLLHNQTQLIGAMKARWDPNRSQGGDFIFEIVPPRNLDLDMAAAIPDDGFTADNMQVIIEHISEPTSVVLAKFPGKKKELLEAIRSDKDGKYPSRLRYQEVHFTFYNEKGEKIEGVGWKYNQVVLDKRRTPYFDYTGYERASNTPQFDPEGNLVFNPFDQTPVFESEQVYRNFFEVPRKPYMFFSYLTDGEGPLDISTPVEQSISLQRNLNRRGRQISEIADNVAPKLVFNGQYITKEEVRRISRDPNEHVWIKGEKDTPIGNMVMTYQSAAPDQSLVQDMQITRSRIDSKFNTNASTRGAVVDDQSGVSKQISREGDLAISDDIVEIVVERIAYEMTCWAIQFMRLYYDKEHWTRTIGKDGEAIAIAMHQDRIDDGVAVDVQSSATDLAERRANAMQLIQSNSIDPMTLYEDLDVANPKERVRRNIKWQLGQMDGYTKYLEELGMEPIVQPQPAMAPGGAPGAMLGAAEAQADLQLLLQGQQPQPAGQPGPEYVQVFVDFVGGGEFDGLDPQTQDLISQYIESLKGLLSESPPAQ